MRNLKEFFTIVKDGFIHARINDKTKKLTIRHNNTVYVDEKQFLKDFGLPMIDIRSLEDLINLIKNH